SSCAPPTPSVAISWAPSSSPASTANLPWNISPPIPPSKSRSVPPHWPSSPNQMLPSITPSIPPASISPRPTDPAHLLQILRPMHRLVRRKDVGIGPADGAILCFDRPGDPFLQPLRVLLGGISQAFLKFLAGFIRAAGQEKEVAAGKVVQVVGRGD